MPPLENKEKTIAAVTFVNVLTNIILAVLKIMIGSFGHSQALVADGIHSFSDVVSDGFVYWSAKASIHAPDADHPYGHQRIETIGTMVISVILLIVALSIGYEAILRFLMHTHLKPTLSVIIIALLSIALNEGLFYYSLIQGKKIHSNLLISNAWHKRSDVFISIIVLLSVIGAFLGVEWLDTVGAIFVTLLIFKIGAQMLWQAGQELIDRAVDTQTLDDMRGVITSVPGVLSIHQLRTRFHGNAIFVDLHIIVDPFISVSEGHHISEAVHVALMKKIKNIQDITVHIDHEDDEANHHPSLNLPNRKSIEALLFEKWHHFPEYKTIKKMNLHYYQGKLSIEIFFNEKPLTSRLDQLRLSLRDLSYLKRIDFYYE